VKKLIAIALTVSLISTSIPPRAAEASWFSDVFGGLFTFITAPIWIFCQDNPTFRKNNPFRKKIWEEQAEIEDEIRRRVAAIPPRIERDVITPEPKTEYIYINKDTDEVILPTYEGFKPSPNPPTPTIDSDLQQDEDLIRPHIKKLTEEENLPDLFTDWLIKGALKHREGSLFRHDGAAEAEIKFDSPEEAKAWVEDYIDKKFCGSNNIPPKRCLVYMFKEACARTVGGIAYEWALDFIEFPENNDITDEQGRELMEQVEESIYNLDAQTFKHMFASQENLTTTVLGFAKEGGVFEQLLNKIRTSVPPYERERRAISRTERKSKLFSTEASAF
jgi:hypothetical protein